MSGDNSGSTARPSLNLGIFYEDNFATTVGLRLDDTKCWRKSMRLGQSTEGWSPKPHSAAPSIRLLRTIQTIPGIVPKATLYTGTRTLAKENIWSTRGVRTVMKQIRPARTGRPRVELPTPRFPLVSALAMRAGRITQLHQHGLVLDPAHTSSRADLLI